MMYGWLETERHGSVYACDVCLNERLKVSSLMQKGDGNKGIRHPGLHTYQHHIKTVSRLFIYYFWGVGVGKGGSGRGGK